MSEGTEGSRTCLANGLQNWPWDTSCWISLYPLHSEALAEHISFLLQQHKKTFQQPPPTEQLHLIAEEKRPPLAYAAKGHKTRWDPHRKELPRGALTPEAGWCYMLTSAPKDQMCTFPSHPDVGAVTSLTRAWDTKDRALKERLILASTVSLTQEDPQRHSSLPPVSWGTDTGLQQRKRWPMLATFNRGWGGGRLSFIWHALRQLNNWGPSAQLPPMPVNKCMCLQGQFRKSWGGQLASSFQVPLGMSLSLCMDAFSSKHNPQYSENTDSSGP